jgi:oligoribonuclease (3'-5' exoribonuclease)
MYPDVMLDIETLSRHADALVTQIGICGFDIDSGAHHQGLCINLPIQPQLDIDRKIEASTLYWWINTMLKAGYCSWTYAPCETVLEALGRIDDYIKEFSNSKDGPRLWSHSFDTNIMSHLYNQYGRCPPWSYRKQFDIRTLVEMAKRYGVKPANTVAEKTHDALDDCIYQIEYCSYAWSQLPDVHNNKHI